MACRLCECPFLDGGLPIAQLDTEAWTNWCLEYLGVQLDQCDEAASWICQFCIMQARYYYVCYIGSSIWKFLVAEKRIYDPVFSQLVNLLKL
jgi:hypothetical protein